MSEWKIVDDARFPKKLSKLVTGDFFCFNSSIYMFLEEFLDDKGCVAYKVFVVEHKKIVVFNNPETRIFKLNVKVEVSIN